MFTQIKHRSFIQQPVEYNDSIEIFKMQQHLQRIAYIHCIQLSILSNVIIYGKRIAVGPQLFQLAILVNKIKIAEIVYSEIGYSTPVILNKMKYTIGLRKTLR